jgi:beta-mannosidase
MANLLPNRSLLAAILFSIACAPMARADVPKILSLNGAWQVKQADKPDMMPATVPGCIHLDLLANKKIPDPFYRDNETQLQWIGDKSWTYNRTFTVPADYLQHQNVRLKCEGLDTLATVRINGQEIAHTDNMFRTWEFDVKNVLKAGENTIEATFDPIGPYLSAHKTQDAFPNHVVEGHGYIRKEACNFGWDWGPKLATCGIWRPIELVAWDVARLDNVQIAQDHSQSGTVKLGVTVAAESDGKMPLSADIAVLFQQNVVTKSTVALTGNHGDLTLDIPNPQLWWPNEMGPHDLYTVQVTLHGAQGEVLDEHTTRIGLRTIEWRTKTADCPAGLIVNGRPFYAKGASWIPPEVFAPKATPELLRHYMTDAVAVHMNMIRLWGGGYYEEDALYDACDELGILLWVDMKFANNAYPVFDPAFVDNVQHELKDNVTRLRDHPSIAVWCGNNEASYLIGDWTKGRTSKEDYDHLFNDIIGGEIKQLVPNAQYVEGSPGGGESHNWGAFEDYPRSHGFMSEFGYESFPDPKTMATVSEPDDRTGPLAPIMEFHQRKAPPKGTTNANEAIQSKLLEYFRTPKDFDSFVWVSQMMQVYGIKLGVEHWRSDWPNSTGSLVWQYNDCWPVVSWAMVDYGQRWKALMYAAQHFFSPLLISGTINIGKREATLVVSNDNAEASSGTVSWSLTDLGGTEVDHGSSDVTIPAGTSNTTLPALELKDSVQKIGKNNALLWVKLEVNGAVVSRNLLTFVRYKDLVLQDPALTTKVSASGDGYDVTITAAHPALFTWLDLPDADARYSDNFINLRAHEPVTVHMTPASAMALDAVQKQLHARSLFDTYDATTSAPAPTPISEDHPVTVSSTSKDAGLEADNAVDGDENTRWSSDSKDNQWIYVDLGSSRKIDEIKLDWETAAGKDYDLEVSDDATNWITVKSITNNSAIGWLNYPNLNAKGRYVRVNCKTRATNYGFSLWEFQVFGP